MPSLGLSMIVKNAADTLRLCLESVRGVVDQIVVADTGCTDNTCDIAREFGATIISTPWQNHFADARNAALKPMQTDWVLVLDPDEELDRDAQARIPKLLLAAEVGGYITPIRNYVPCMVTRGWDRTTMPNDGSHPRAKDAPAYFINENCRLFRRHPEIYFRGRVHELVEYQIRALGLKCQRANFFIHHFGHLADPESRENKNAFYHELLRLKIQEMPDDATAWVQYGLDEYEEHKNTEEALRCFDQALRLQPECPTTWLFKGMVYCQSGRYEEALHALERAGSGEDGAVLRDRLKGDALRNLGRLKEARMAYRRALKLNRSDWLLQAKLGYTESKLGHKGSGIAKLQCAAAKLPEMFEVHDLLLKAYLNADRVPEAAEEAERFTAVTAHPELFLRAAGLRARLRQWDKVEKVSAQGVQLFPQSTELHDVLMKAYIVAGRLHEAAEVAERIAHAVAHPKLFLRAASIYAQLQQGGRAEQLLSQGLELFPESAELQQALAEIRPSNGRMLAILGFHKIGEPPAGAGSSRWYVPGPTFRNQLKALTMSGWEVISIDAFLKGLSEPDSLPPRAALLTFDDGYKSVLEVASPLLSEFGYPSVVFVPTQFVGGYNDFDQGIEPREPICSWNDLRELERRGCSIQSHGVRHSSFPELAHEEQQEELRHSKDVIEAELGKPVEVFAFPYGQAGMDRMRVRELLQRTGYRAACLFDGGVSKLPFHNAYCLTRVPMYPDSDLTALLGS